MQCESHGRVANIQINQVYEVVKIDISENKMEELLCINPHLTKEWAMLMLQVVNFNKGYERRH